MKLKVKSSKVSYDLELRHKLTLIIGDSATGKTTLINTINNANRDKRTIIESGYPVIIINNMDVLRDGIDLGKSRIYVIDERDVTNEFGRLYNESLNSYFIVISRDVINNISYSPESLCTLQKNGREHYLQYIDVVDSKYKEGVVINAILTEDSGAGYRWLKEVIRNCEVTSTSRECGKAGNSGIIDSVRGLLSEADKPIYVFVDFGGFGYYYQTFTNLFRKDIIDGNLYFNKEYICFEYLLAKSNIVKAGNLTIEEELSSKSLENAWEIKLADLTKDKAYYHKHRSSHCSMCYIAPCCCIIDSNKRAELGRCDGRLIGDDKFKLMFRRTEFEYLINMKEVL